MDITFKNLQWAFKSFHFKAQYYQLALEQQVPHLGDEALEQQVPHLGEGAFEQQVPHLGDEALEEKIDLQVLEASWSGDRPA